MDLYCTQCHRECKQLDDDDPDGRAELLSDCHTAPTLSGDDKWIVMAIRRLWAADSAIIRGGVEHQHFNPDYPFGTGEEKDADMNLLAAFKAERQYHDDDLHTIWVLIRG